MSDDKYPVTKRSDIPFGDIPSVKKKHGESFEDAAHDPNTPSMKRYHGKSSINPYLDYCEVPETDDQNPYQDKD